MALFEPKLIENYVEQLVLDSLSKNDKPNLNGSRSSGVPGQTRSGIGGKRGDVSSQIKSDLSTIVNNEELCKLNENVYVVCNDYCCGEIWESKRHFCCTNNFKPTRNLFYFLLISFVVLFATIVIYLIIESLVRRPVLRKIKRAEDLFNVDQYHPSKSKSSPSPNRDTTTEDDSSSDYQASKSRPKVTKNMLVKHSRLFKDMTRMKSSRRKTLIKTTTRRRTKNKKSMRRPSIKR